MLTIRVPQDLERTIEEQAQNRGTTPELLVLEALHRRFSPALSAQEEEGSLADFLGEFVGCIQSSQTTPGGAQMSTDPGRKFAEGMVKKRREARL